MGPPAARLLQRCAKTLEPAPRTSSGRLTDRTHVEPVDSYGRHRGPGEPVAPLARQRWHCDANGLDAPQQVDRALVEAEVRRNADNLPALDQVDTVARKTRKEERLRVNLADVPEARHEESPIRVGDELFESCAGTTFGYHQVVDARRARHSGELRAVARLQQRREPAVMDPVCCRQSEAVGEH